MLRTISEIPPGLMEADAKDLKTILGGPTLIRLEGRRQPPLFVSVLLHGNETTGFDAIKRVLARYEPGGGKQQLPRSLNLFIGNVFAAEIGARRLAAQPDYNRIWPGCDAPRSPERDMMALIVGEMKDSPPFASIDVHNTTGTNPHYACFTEMDRSTLHLASVYSRTVVFFRIPPGSQTMAFDGICPAITLECGQVGDPRSTPHTAEFIDGCLHMAGFPEHDVADHDYNVFHTVARVSVPQDVSFGFNGEATDIQFRSDLDHLNFNELPPGTEFGRVQGQASGLIITDEIGQTVEGRYFRVDHGRLVTSMPIMPSMLTLNADVVRQDCLGYIMERFPREKWGSRIKHQGSGEPHAAE